MIEIDGPAAAYFEYANGEREVYTVRALMSANAGDLVDAYQAWYRNIDAVYSNTRMLVWRARPKIEFDNDALIETPEGFGSNPHPHPRWRLTYRYALVGFHGLPVVEPPIKEEGRPVQML
jgi:hypothetical protein